MPWQIHINIPLALSRSHLPILHPLQFAVHLFFSIRICVIRPPTPRPSTTREPQHFHKVHNEESGSECAAVDADLCISILRHYSQQKHNIYIHVCVCVRVCDITTFALHAPGEGIQNQLIMLRPFLACFLEFSKSTKLSLMIKLFR